ncbi:hypothetical protein D3C77_284520 [compost metagenome]
MLAAEAGRLHRAGISPSAMSLPAGKRCLHLQNPDLCLLSAKAAAEAGFRPPRLNQQRIPAAMQT